MIVLCLICLKTSPRSDATPKVIFYPATLLTLSIKPWRALVITNPALNMMIDHIVCIIMGTFSELSLFWEGSLNIFPCPVTLTECHFLESHLSLFKILKKNKKIKMS